MRQIFHIKKAAEKSISARWEWEAKLQDKQIKGAELKKQPNLSRKEDEYFDNQAKEMLARMQKRYAEQSRIKHKDNGLS